jgi:ketosteroid isomerase-like protein
MSRAAVRNTPLVSRENVELVRRALRAVYQHPKPDFDTLNALYSPDHEQIGLASQVEGRTAARGARAFRETLDSFSETFERWEGRIDEIRAIDDDHVLVTGLFSAVGKRGNVPVEQRYAHLVTVRDRKITRTESFSSPEAALQTIRADGA